MFMDECMSILVFPITVFMHTLCRLFAYDSVLVSLSSFALACVLTYLHMSHNPGDWHTS